MTIYSIDVKIYGTAYIQADSEQDALEKAKGLNMLALELLEQDGEVPISGKSFDSTDLPDVSLSPAMTIYGPDEGALPDPIDED